MHRWPKTSASLSRFALGPHAATLVALLALFTFVAVQACQRPPVTPVPSPTIPDASASEDAAAPAPAFDAGVTPDASSRIALRFCGTNLSGAEFGTKIPGTTGVDYQWPDPSDIEYFLAQGMNHFRFPYRLERLQPTPRGPLDATEWQQLQYRLAYATNRKATVLFDLHNSFRRGTNCDPLKAVDARCTTLTTADVADIGAKLGAKVKDYPHVMLGASNEPHHMTTETIRDLDQAFVTGARGAGFTGVILVSGNAFSGGSHWFESYYGTPNSKILQEIAPGDANVWFEVHQYLDAEASGAGPCVSATIGVERLNAVTNWLRTLGRKAFLAEIGAPDSPVCRSAVQNVLVFLNANADVWQGFTWWSAGVWSFATTYPLSLGPSEPAKPQLAWITPFLPCSEH